MLVDAYDLTSNARGSSSGYRGMGCRAPGSGSSTLGLRTCWEECSDCTPPLVAANGTAAHISCAVIIESQEVRAVCSGVVR